MSLNPSLTLEAWLLVKSQTLSEAAAKRLSQVLGSREELVAHLLLDQQISQSYPELCKALSTAAKRVYAAPSTTRPYKGDAKMRRELADASDAALTALIKSESDHIALSDGAHSALRAYARQEDGFCASLGYQWWVACESR